MSSTQLFEHFLKQSHQTHVMPFLVLLQNISLSAWSNQLPIGGNQLPTPKKLKYLILKLLINYHRTHGVNTQFMQSISLPNPTKHALTCSNILYQQSNLKYHSHTINTTYMHQSSYKFINFVFLWIQALIHNTIHMTMDVKTFRFQLHSSCIKFSNIRSTNLHINYHNYHRIFINAYKA